MLLQTRNITLVPRGVHVGFVVVLLLPEKVKPFGPLEISQNRVFGSDFFLGNSILTIGKTQKSKTVNVTFPVA